MGRQERQIPSKETDVWRHGALLRDMKCQRVTCSAKERLTSSKRDIQCQRETCSVKELHATPKRDLQHQRSSWTYTWRVNKRDVVPKRHATPNRDIKFQKWHTYTAMSKSPIGGEKNTVNVKRDRYVDCQKRQWTTKKSIHYEGNALQRQTGAYSVKKFLQRYREIWSINKRHRTPTRDFQHHKDKMSCMWVKDELYVSRRWLVCKWMVCHM